MPKQESWYAGGNFPGVDMQPLTDTLQKLEQLRDLVDRYNPIKFQSSVETRELGRMIPELYGEVEEVYQRFAGDLRVELIDGKHKHVFENYFEAGYLSGRTFHSTEGYRELLKVIGRVKAEIAKTPQDLSAESMSAAAWRLLHSKVRGAASARFTAGHFADAVEATFKALINEVKAIVKARGGADMDGANLMHTAFSPRNPIIVLADLSTQSGKDMQQGYMELFAGSVSAIRNPKAHANVDISSERALHMLFLASLLWETLDSRA